MESKETVKFTIDGVEVEAEKGQTILDIACKHGIDIPTLCHHKALDGYSACRLCSVEVTKKGRTKLTASCTYPVQDGIDVKTNSEDVVKIRRMVMESLLASAPNSEDIKDLAKDFGVDNTRFKICEDKENKCIMCGLCVRICKNRVGLGAIGFGNRGAKRTITTPFGELSDFCSTCGACSVVCPTGAINLKEF